jgi:lysophospholipase L1-like esterase
MQPGKFDVILGDSITEGAFLQTADSRPLLNAAIGGGGIDSMYPMLNQLETYRGRIDRALLAIGVNDAQRGAISAYPNGRSAYLDHWAQHYEAVAQGLAGLGAKVTLFPILPVEDSKPMGTGYFDPEAIQDMNETIREIAKKHGWPIANVAVPTAGNSTGILATDSTVDGVHPTSATYRIFVDAVRSALK